MKRRQVVKNIGLALGAVTASARLIASNPGPTPRPGRKKRVLRVAHITDVHIRPEYNAPNRFRKCMEDIKKHGIDLILNGGDTIYAADYGNITRERVLDQWRIWDELRSEFKDIDVHSCLGNHDMWWAAPDKQDAMYGKDFVVKKLGLPNRYYSFDKGGWHFIILDSNNKNAGSLDEEQRKWLESDMSALPDKCPILVMSHFPILGVCTILEGGNHTDSGYITDLFYRHRDKKVACLSGHIHLLDNAIYNDVHFYCNGALSGYWWEDGDSKSAGKYYYKQTPPGYAIVDLYDDGSMTNEYIPHPY